MSLKAYDRLRVVVALAGLAVSAYLTLLHYNTDVPLACGAGSFVNCHQVLTSPASVLLGVPVAVWGLLWFVFALVLAVLFLRRHPGSESLALRTAGLGWTLAGTVTVLWLVYEELGVVGRLCIWCTVVHVLVLALLVIQVQADPSVRR